MSGHKHHDYQDSRVEFKCSITLNLAQWMIRGLRHFPQCITKKQDIKLHEEIIVDSIQMVKKKPHSFPIPRVENDNLAVILILSN